MSLREAIKESEGTGPQRNDRFLPYLDSVGKLTIGYGRNLTDRGLSADEVELLLTNDIASATEDLHRALPWTKSLDAARHDVMVEMCFNLGIIRLILFKKFLAALQNGDFQRAAAEMLDSKWAKQVGERADRLASIIRG